MEDEYFEFIGDALESCHDQALIAWTREYYRHMSWSDAFGEAVRRVTMAVSHHPGGVWIIRVTVHPRRPWQREEYFYRLNEIAGKYYPS